MSIKLAVNFVLILCFAVPLSYATYYGFDQADQAREEQPQLAPDEEAIEKLQELLYSTNPAEVRVRRSFRRYVAMTNVAEHGQNPMYGGDNWQPEAFAVTEDDSWPANVASIASLGDIAGLAVCPAGKLHLFHRGPVVWDAE